MVRMQVNMIEVKQYFDAPPEIDFRKVIHKELERVDIKSIVKPSSRVAITAGSRGITHISDILKCVVEEVKEAGGKPFIIPSMGSHGGATPDGQIRVLFDLGIREDSVGAPIEPSMEVKEVGKLDNGKPVFVSKLALRADSIILVGRVKPHTDFKDEIESGLMKMMVIGLGKQRGAQTLHSNGQYGYHKMLVPTARMIMEKSPVKLGIAIVENQYHQPAIIKALRPHEIESEEKKLLEISKEWMMKIPFKNLDILIVEKMGKNISGTGMDPNVTGRFVFADEKPKDSPNIRLVIALDLTKETEGNAIGLGLADIITKRLFDKINYNDTYMNALTAGLVGALGVKIPPIIPTDKDAVELALTLLDKHDGSARIMRIKNTLELATFHVSEALLDEVKSNPKLEQIGEPTSMEFDILGNLT